MQLTVAHDFLPKLNSARASMVMDHFGINFEKGKHVVADGVEIPIEEGQVILFTGESGSGKSSLMKAVAEQLTRTTKSIVNLDDIDLGEQILVESLDLSFSESLQLLVTCGLGESHLMLRTPKELSDGQRYRFRLAKAISMTPDWIIADEFTATLDRTLAKVISFNLRKLCSRTSIGFLLATTHEDVVDDLSPDIHVIPHLSGNIEVIQPNSGDRKKKVSHSPPDSGSQKAPNSTGRTSLGGIIAATVSD